MQEKKPDSLKRLNVALAQNPVWRTLAQKTSEVINEMISDKRWALSRLREPELVSRNDWMDTPIGRGKVTMVRRRRSNINIDANTYDFEDTVEIEVPGQGFVQLPVRILHDRDSLIQSSRFSGFDYFSDFLQDDDYSRIHAFVGKYWNSSSGENFVDFLGYLSRIRFEIEELWEYEKGDPGQPSDQREPLSAIDEYDLLEPFNGGMQAIWDDPAFNPLSGIDTGSAGSVYPTSHIALAYDILDHPVIDRFSIASLFYYLAPIHLVLARFVGTIYAQDTLYSGVTIQGHTIPEFINAWDNEAIIHVRAGQTTQLHTIPQFIARQEVPLP